jgi:hypothetical protein
MESVQKKALKSFDKHKTTFPLNFRYENKVNYFVVMLTHCNIGKQEIAFNDDNWIRFFAQKRIGIVSNFVDFTYVQVPGII